MKPGDLVISKYPKDPIAMWSHNDYLNHMREDMIGYLEPGQIGLIIQEDQPNQDYHTRYERILTSGGIIGYISPSFIKPLK